eukprot:4939183-Pyramimonas_sp.AAC.1
MSSMFRPREPKSDDSYRGPMARFGLDRELRAGPHGGGLASDTNVATHSQTRLPLDISSIFRPQEPKNDDLLSEADDLPRRPTPNTFLDSSLKSKKWRL